MQTLTSMYFFSNTVIIYWQVGTLDTLVGLSDDLGKLDGFVERYTYMYTKIHQKVLKDIMKLNWNFF